MPADHQTSRRRLVLVVLAPVLAFTYFVMFPDDVESLVAPLARVVSFLETVLGVSESVSPWLYGTVMVGIAAWAVVRVWGPRSGGATRTGS